MTYSNDELLQKLDSALKNVGVDTLGQGILAPQKFDRFVRAMQIRTKILPEARFIRMESQITDIDRVGFVGRVITQAVAPNPPANSLSGAVEDTVGTETSVAPVFGTQVLRAVELRAMTGISDRALRRNIERGDFENTLVDLFGEAAGRDFEEFAILSDANNTADPLLSLMNGWATGAANRVYGVQGANQAAEFDPTDPESIFEALLDALPKQYLQNRAEWRFYVPYEIENKYRDVLRQRGTALGDAAQIGHEGLKYKGIPIVEVPMLERANVVAGGADFSGGVGRICMLQHPDNMVWGVFHQVSIERDRDIRNRRTDFVLTIEADAGYENPNAAAVAFLDIKNQKQ
ncbi:phage major capsid protein [Candidatus Darwinibacter acetoxidans]